MTVEMEVMKTSPLFAETLLVVSSYMYMKLEGDIATVDG